ncbi:MAG: hypothetical protein JXR77_01165 [Lentisphaeria bacterium]|nr:hypothetical protein [Lentisphaeria bacterium]
MGPQKRGAAFACARRCLASGHLAMAVAGISVEGEPVGQSTSGEGGDDVSSPGARRFASVSVSKAITAAASESLDTDRFTPGVKLFRDRSYTLAEGAPGLLLGLMFLRAPITGTRTLVCAEGGMLYALTPALRPGAASQAGALEAAGFARHPMAEFQLFGENPIDRVILYTREIRKGDTLRFGKWTLLLAPAAVLRRAEVRWETLYNGIRLACDPCERSDMTAYGRDPLPVPYLEHVPDVIPIDIGRQLFVDDFLIEETSLQRTWHKARKDPRSPVLTPVTDLELGTKSGHPAMAAPFSGGVWYDHTDGLFKAWYCAGWFDGTAYAFSRDGLYWERPELDIEPGTNRVVPRKGARDSCAVILDPHAPPGGDRFKMLLWSRPQGGELFVSKDGIHWSEPLPTGSTGDRTTIFYNPFRRRWVYSLRAGWSARSRNYSESEDFLAGAGFPDQVPWLRADAFDIPDPHWIYAFPEREPERGGDRPQLYNFDAVAYESLMLGAFTIHLGPDNGTCARLRVPKITEIHLGFSRDGFHWSRPDDRTPFLPASRSEGTWDRAYLHSNAALCLVMGDELWFYYTGFRGDPTREGVGLYSHASMGIARLRRDGFASLDAGTEEGTLITRVLRFSRGDRLFVNVDAPRGELCAEILQADGSAVDGLSFADCEPVSTDSTRIAVTWRGGRDLAALRGQPVRVRFRLRSGSLYAFWVAGASGAGRGYLAGGGPGFPGLVDVGTPR